jgi:hypothetical protein
MSNKIDTGGPAFPRPVSEDTTQGNQHDGNKTVAEQDGMTLRDYFAAHAPNPPSGWIGSSDDENKNIQNLLSRPDNSIYAMIEWRWFYADQMLAARKAVRP